MRIIKKEYIILRIVPYSYGFRGAYTSTICRMIKGYSKKEKKRIKKLFKKEYKEKFGIEIKPGEHIKIINIPNTFKTDKRMSFWTKKDINENISYYKLVDKKLIEIEKEVLCFDDLMEFLNIMKIKFEEIDALILNDLLLKYLMYDDRFKKANKIILKESRK